MLRTINRFMSIAVKRKAWVVGIGGDLLLALYTDIAKKHLLLTIHS
jgi:hypothetical protein